MSITEALYEETENLVSGETNFEGILDRMMDRGTDYLNDKIEELFTGNPIGRAVYKTAYVSNANRILSGEEYGFRIKEVDKDTLDRVEYRDLNGSRRKGVLGYGEGENIYIPEVDAVKEMFPGVTEELAKGIQDYIRVHEIFEPNVMPGNENEHADMDAKAITALKYLSYINEDARNAYEGAMYVHGQREENDGFGSRVRNYLHKYLSGEEKLN